MSISASRRLHKILQVNDNRLWRHSLLNFRNKSFKKLETLYAGFSVSGEAQEFSEHGNSLMKRLLFAEQYEIFANQCEIPIFNKNIYRFYINIVTCTFDCISPITFSTLCFVSFDRWFVKKVTS